MGRNGIGKTTLLRALSRYELPGFPKHLKILQVEQEVRGTAQSVHECVVKADLEREYLLGREKGECDLSCVPIYRQKPGPASLVWPLCS